MAAKKRGRKTTKSARKTSKRSSGRSVSKKTKAPRRMILASDKKFSLLTTNLIMFAAMFIISLGLYSVSSNEFYTNLFWMLSIIAGFITLALFIVYLIFVLLRYLRK